MTVVYRLNTTLDRGFHHIRDILREYWQDHGSAMVNDEWPLSGWHSSAAIGGSWPVGAVRGP
jgi:hypothetical protein